MERFTHESPTPNCGSTDLPHRAHRIESQRVAIYGTTQRNNRAHLGYLYDRHHEHVEQYFKNRADDLLVMNIFDGDGWDVLYPFLGKPIPDVPFPCKQSKTT